MLRGLQFQKKKKLENGNLQKSEHLSYSDMDNGITEVRFTL